MTKEKKILLKALLNEYKREKLLQGRLLTIYTTSPQLSFIKSRKTFQITFSNLGKSFGFSNNLVIGYQEQDKIKPILTKLITIVNPYTKQKWGMMLKNVNRGMFDAPKSWEYESSDGYKLIVKNT